MIWGGVKKGKSSLTPPERNGIEYESRPIEKKKQASGEGVRNGVWADGSKGAKKRSRDSMDIDEDKNEPVYDLLYDQMTDLFIDIGKTSVETTLLKYFKKKRGDRSLTRDSVVFPKSETSNMIMLNKLTERKCLRDNWTKIKYSCPCIDGLHYVVGDADSKYAMEFPYHDMDTETVDGVETVRDFVDFTMSLLIKL